MPSTPASPPRSCPGWRRAHCPGPGAGGFMLVHRARDRSTRLLDFFVADAGARRSGRAPSAEMESVDVDFSGESTQAFRIGSASCAVPGATAGLAAVHRRFGTPALADALRAGDRGRPDGDRADASAGVPARDPRPDPAPHRRGAARLRRSRRARLGRRRRPAPSRSRRRRWSGWPRGRTTCTRANWRGTIVGHLRDTGGAVTAEDLRGYRVIWRRPVRRVQRLHVRVESAAVVRRGPDRLRAGLLDRLPGGPPGSPEAIAALVEVMREQAGRGRPLHNAAASRGARAHLFADGT